MYISAPALILRRVLSVMLEAHSSSSPQSRDSEIRHKTNTKKPSLELTIEELEVLLPLASDQLFRNEFIDTRMPGFEKNREEIQSAKAVIHRLKERVHQAKQKPGDTLRFSIQYR